jgi:phosphotransferase system enzyme I (PtsI)
MSERRLDGIGVTPLVGVGTVVWYRPDTTLELPDPPDPVTIDPEAQLSRFESARQEARAEISRERDRLAAHVGEDEAAVFDAHAQFIDDPQIESGVDGAVEDGLPAEHAVHETFQEHIDQFESMDGQMVERADDLRDVRDRLLRLLLERERVDLESLPEGSIVLAERLTPSDTAQLDPERVKGFATVSGGRTSHAAIFARSLALPAIVGVGEALREIEDGATIAIDGESGTVVVDPTGEVKKELQTKSDTEVIADPVSTADGTNIEVAANVGTQADLGPAATRGADGIGLYRTEFLFLDRESPPDETEQFRAYREAIETFPGDRVIVRTLDVGGDKPVPYLDLPDEENPFLGDRGVRRSLDADAALFETQLRALLRAAGSEGDKGLALMLPLVTTVSEVYEARNRIEAVANDLDDEGIDYRYPEFGIMIETPAAVFMADTLAEEVDFFSIGTNDLTQYVMAAERGNERVASLGDYHDPSVLRAIRDTIEGAADKDCWVGMCGEMAGDPNLTKLLIGLGLDELSMSAVSIPAVKAAVRETDTTEAREHAERVLAAETKAKVYEIIGE